MLAVPALTVVADRRDGAAVDRSLRSLPDWFGIEAALQESVEAADSSPVAALEELTDVCPGNPCLIMVKAL